MTLSSSEIKRQILISAGTSDIKKKMDRNPPGISEGEQIEMGNELEAVTKMKGWILVESFILRRMNLIGLVLNDDEKNKDQKGIAKGYIELMQWIQLVIQRRDDILEKEKLKHETKNVSKGKASKGSDLAKFKPTEAGGPVEGIIIGPESSVGTVATHPTVDQGNDKGIKVA